MWRLMLSTRVCAQQRGAKDAAIFPPGELKEVEFHLVKRLCALATDCTAHLNQPRRARNRPGTTMLMAVLEGRAPNRRPQSPTEVAARSLAAAAADVIGFFLGGLGRS